MSGVTIEDLGDDVASVIDRLGHGPAVWLSGWYPRALAMQRAAVTGIDIGRYWGAGHALFPEAPRRRRCRDHVSAHHDLIDSTWPADTNG